MVRGQVTLKYLIKMGPNLSDKESVKEVNNFETEKYVQPYSYVGRGHSYIVIPTRKFVNPF